MIYTTKAGDSFITIAASLTSNQDYAYALAELAGLADESGSWSSDAKFALVSSPLPAGSQIEIPDDWLRVTPAYVSGSGGVFSDSFFKWAGLALALVALLRS